MLSSPAGSTEEKLVKMKKRKATSVILILIFLAGLSLLLYPSFSDHWNKFRSTQVISDYSGVVADLNQEKYEQMYSAARQYNDDLARNGSHYRLSDQQRARYEATLNIYDGVMGYIEIEKLHATLPIYHGTEENVLQTAVGHLDWTSLPVGGEGSHCVLSGHRGLPSARLFTGLDQLQEGDTFMLNVLDKVLTYEVDQIRIVEPEDITDLTIEKGKDYCTLVTCTPYGINTHRLLVRGHRIENGAMADALRVTTDAIQIEPTIVAPILAVPMLLTLLAAVMMRSSGIRVKGKRNRGEANE